MLGEGFLLCTAIVPALAGSVLSLERDSKQLEIHGETPSDRLKPGLHTLYPSHLCEIGGVRDYSHSSLWDEAYLKLAALDGLSRVEQNQWGRAVPTPTDGPVESSDCGRAQYCPECGIDNTGQPHSPALCPTEGAREKPPQLCGVVQAGDSSG
jgi:hypothetical protein